MNKNKNITKEILVFDAHCDTANFLYDPTSYFIQENISHFNIDKARSGGLKAQIFALYVNPVYAPSKSIKKALLLYNTLEKRLYSTGDAVKVTSTNEMESSLQKNKLACWLSLESGHIIENSLDILEFFHNIGIKCMTLTHTKNTDWADSSGDIPNHNGLTKLGRKIITKMNKLGMVVDVSHSSDKTIEDVLEITSKPIMASHSCSRALCDIPRNLPDSLIVEIANRNGYIGVNFYPGFLKKSINEQIMKNIEKESVRFNKQIKGKEDNPDLINRAEMKLCSKIVKGIDNVDLNAVIEHILHIVDVGGIDCVGLGSDFDGIPFTPKGLEDVSKMPNITYELVKRGYIEEDIMKIIGNNHLRLIKEVVG